MKKLFGCLALIGLGIILAIGGCLGLIGYGIVSMPKIPDYATRSAIEGQYAKDLKLIDQGLGLGKPEALSKQVSSDIAAIYDGHEDVLKKANIFSESYHAANGIGVGTLLTGSGKVQCIVYELKKEGASYEIFIVDHGPPAKPAPSPAH